MNGYEGLWGYLVLMLVGFLPNDVWRLLGVVVGRGLDEESELLVWVRAVATAVLAGVIANDPVLSAGIAGDRAACRCGWRRSAAASWHSCWCGDRSLPALPAGEAVADRGRLLAGAG